MQIYNYLFELQDLMYKIRHFVFRITNAYTATFRIANSEERGIGLSIISSTDNPLGKKRVIHFVRIVF